MKLNQDKCHLLISGHKYESVWANIGSCKICESNEQKLRGVNIDSKLNFSHYILKQWKKAGRELSALSARESFHEILLNLSCHTVP